MQTRTITGNLNIQNEDYIFAGNLKITGDLVIENASLIVSGSISFSDNSSIHVINGDISTNDIYGHVNISIYVGDIYCHTVLAVRDIHILGGDIIASSLYADIIKSDGDIILLDEANVFSVSCRNYLVNGDNDSLGITAVEDIYILGNKNDSFSLNARDIFLDCNYIQLHNYPIIASRAIATSCPINGCTTIIAGQ